MALFRWSGGAPTTVIEPATLNAKILLLSTGSVRITHGGGIVDGVAFALGPRAEPVSVMWPPTMVGVEIELAPFTPMPLAPAFARHGVLDLADPGCADLRSWLEAVTNGFDPIDDIVGRLCCNPLGGTDVDDQLDGVMSAVRSGSVTRVDQLVERTGWSHRHVLERFRDTWGVRPKTALRIARAQRAEHLIEAGAALVDVATRAGYADQPHLTREFASLHGRTPGQHRSAPSEPLAIAWDRACST